MSYFYSAEFSYPKKYSFLFSFLSVQSKIVTNEKLSFSEEPQRGSRIMTPSRVILPPEIPHYIFFQPLLPQPSTTEASEGNATIPPPSPPPSCQDEDSPVCGYDEQSYPHNLVRTVVQTHQAELDRLVQIIKPQGLEVCMFQYFLKNTYICYHMLHCYNNIS